MLLVTTIREQKEQLIKQLEIRGFKDALTKLEEIIRIDDLRKQAKAEMDSQRADSNAYAKQIGVLFKQGKGEEASALKTKTTALKESIKLLTEDLSIAEKNLQNLLLTIPNIPHISVPKGNSDTDNEIIFESSKKANIDEKAKPHWELTDKYNLIDFELGVKITGAGFPVYKGKGARLQRALINFFLDEATEHGYNEVQPPLLVNETSAYGTGQLPDKEGQMYHCQTDDLYLIPTAEVPITNIYRDVILKEADFPIKNCGYTPCFRREAGSYGKDVRGLNRLHQFDKVEVVQVVHPQDSYQVLSSMVEYVKSLLEKLELPYRVLRLCGGDLGFTSALTFDLEVYSAAQKKWLEVSSVSNFESFQANRLKLRYRDAKGNMQFAHTLNGSALALPRIVAALIENNQCENGIKIPQALVKYTGFNLIN